MTDLRVVGVDLRHIGGVDGREMRGGDRKYRLEEMELVAARLIFSTSLCNCGGGTLSPLLSDLTHVLSLSCMY